MLKKIGDCLFEFVFFEIPETVGKLFPKFLSSKLSYCAVYVVYLCLVWGFLWLIGVRGNPAKEASRIVREKENAAAAKKWQHDEFQRKMIHSLQQSNEKPR